MKKAVLKKVAIGVAVLLALAGITALVSGLFDGRASSSNGAACKHETRTTDGEIAPTCTVSGVSGMVRCLDCGEIVVEGEELPPVGHTGELGETCTVCNEFIYGRYQNPNFYSEQAVAVGENVAGNWYRIYDGGSMGVLADLVGSQYEPTATFYCDFSISQGFIAQAGYSSGYRVADMPYVITEDYIDVYLVPGEYKLSGNSTVTFEITEETTITGINGAKVYRLVFSE